MRYMQRQHFLAPGEFSDEMIDVVLQFFIASAGIHQRTGTEIMPGCMAAQPGIGTLPTAVWRGVRRKASRLSKVVQKSIGI